MCDRWRRWVFKIGNRWPYFTLFGITICWIDLWTGKLGLEISSWNRNRVWLCIGFGDNANE